jgi:hypothetical protein
MESALVHRKRSSRIALIESEKEEARLTARRHAEEKEKMSRSRRLEVRKQREEEERLRREQGRELRRKEREARELRRQTELEELVSIYWDYFTSLKYASGMRISQAIVNRKLRFLPLRNNPILKRYPPNLVF